MKTLSAWLKAVISGGAILLTGCLVSEEPLLDASSGRAKPVRAGNYQMCSFSDGEPDGECEMTAITIGPDRLYSMSESNGETNFLRFRKVGRRAYLVQLLGEDESEGFVYYLANTRRNAFTLTMMNCPDLPAAFRDEFIASGSMETEENGAVCAVSALDAVVSAAKLYASENGPPQRYYIEFARQ